MHSLCTWRLGCVRRETSRWFYCLLEGLVQERNNAGHEINCISLLRLPEYLRVCAPTCTKLPTAIGDSLVDARVDLISDRQERRMRYR